MQHSPHKAILLELAVGPLKGKFAGWPAMEIPQKAARFILMETSMMKALLLLARNTDIAYFVTGIPFVLPSILLAKSIGLKVVIQCGGTAYYARIAGKTIPSYYDRLIGILESLCFRTANLLAVETPQSGRFLRLDRYRKSIAYFGSFTFVDTTK